MTEDASISPQDLTRVRAAMATWKGPELSAAFNGARVSFYMDAWAQFVDTDWENWDIAEYIHDIGVRYWLQVVFEHCAASTRTHLERLVAPIDDIFRRKMRPAAHSKVYRLAVLSGHPYFWETHTLHPELALPTDTA